MDTMKMFAIILICLFGTALSHLQNVNRINYGAMFRHQGYYDNSGATWLHVINIPFSRVPPPEPTSERAEVKSLVDNLSSQFKESWANILQTLQVSFPEASEVRQHHLPPSASVPDLSKQRHLARFSEEERSRLADVTQLKDSGAAKVSLTSTQEITAVQAQLLGIQKKIHARLLKTADEWFQLSDMVVLSADVRAALDVLTTSLKSLLRGRLPLDFVPPASLRAVLDSISQRLATEKPGFRPARSDVSYYYRSGQTASFWSDKAAVLSLVVRVPLTSNATRFHLYKVDTYPIAIRQDSTDVTRLVNVPEYLAVREDGSEYLELSAEDVSLCSVVDNWWSCGVRTSVALASRSSCVMSIFSKDVFATRDTCAYMAVKDGLEADVQAIAPSLMLVSKIDLLSLQCKKSLKTYVGCTQCLVRVPCLCSLLAHGFETRPRLRDCLDNLTIDEAVTPLLTTNLGYLTMVLPASNPLLGILHILQANGSTVTVPDEAIPPLVTGTLSAYTSGLGYAGLHATRGIITAKDEVAPAFAEQWNEALAKNERMFSMEIHMGVALFIVVVVASLCSVCVFCYQRRHIHVLLLTLELNRVNSYFDDETN